VVDGRQLLENFSVDMCKYLGVVQHAHSEKILEEKKQVVIRFVYLK